jgi:ribonuclease P protein component
VIEPRATFPRSVRLRGAAQFTGTFPGRFRSKHFLLLTRPGGSEKGSARLGIIIGRRQVSGSVERSRLRRIIREAFRMCRYELGRIDVVVKYRPEPMKQKKALLRDELNGLLEQAGA